MAILALCLLSHDQSQARAKGPFQVEAKAMQEVSRSGAVGELRLDGLIADLWWRVRLINTDILEEEAKAAFLAALGALGEASGALGGGGPVAAVGTDEEVSHRR